MTPLDPIKFHRVTAKKQLAEFKSLLAKHAELDEGTIAKFFAKRRHLVAAIGLLAGSVDRIDRIGEEYDLFGQHKVDWVVGEATAEKPTYVLIELEDAMKNSIFKSAPNTPYWSARFEHGYSQLLDWLCTVDASSSDANFSQYFGDQYFSTFVGVLLIGRSSFLKAANQGRFRLFWRGDKVLINNRPVVCLTYDQLVERLETKLIS